MNQLSHFLRRLVNVLISNHYTPRLHLSLWSWLISSDTFFLDLGSSRLCYTKPDQDTSDAGLALDTTSPPLPSEHPNDQDPIHRLINNPTLFDHARAPRYPIVLCHGLYGFDVRGPAAFPSLRLHYWSNVLSILKDKLGADVIVTGVPATGSITSRAECLDRILQEKARGRGINLMAHSMGGLDCRHLITHVQPTDPFMDWCTQYLGLGRRQPPRANEPEQQQTHASPEPTSSTDPNSAPEKRDTAFRLSLATLPSSFTTLLLSVIDSPAYANLTTSYLNDVFNPSTPDDPRVKYFSVASRVDEMSIWHPLWFPKMVLDDAERKARDRLRAAAAPNASCSASWEWGNDGLVTVESARWGEFLGILDGCDHWDVRGARRMDVNVEFTAGIGNVTGRLAGEGWSLGDWSRFVGAWRKQEKSASQGFELAQASHVVTSDMQDTRNDPVIKASTDKLSAVFDWIVEHVPAPTAPSQNENQKLSTSNGPPTKFDLERFYVALTRKLYEEGL